jgi:FAD synthetase
MPPSSNSNDQNEKTEKVVVMAFGTFDYFHAGHEDYLNQAKALGNELVVVLARDETVRKVKGRSPVHSERKRLRAVSQCPSVNKAILGNNDDKYKVIKKIRPDVLALGYDQFVFTYGLKQLFIKEKLNTKLVRLEAFEPNTFKSSLIRSKSCKPNPSAT